MSLIGFRPRVGKSVSASLIFHKTSLSIVNPGVRDFRVSDSLVFCSMPARVPIAPSLSIRSTSRLVTGANLGILM